eukprot:2076610-Pleurochrysis_carterae.AAC.2
MVSLSRSCARSSSHITAEYRSCAGMRLPGLFALGQAQLVALLSSGTVFALSYSILNEELSSVWTFATLGRARTWADLPNGKISKRDFRRAIAAQRIDAVRAHLPPALGMSVCLSTSAV